MKNKKTKVIFRKFPNDGGIIAIFPEIAGDENPYNCLSYMHVGQHSSCEPSGLMRSTVPAKPIEYKDLQEELMRIGYEPLEVIHRLHRIFLELRKRIVIP